jgi:predicted DNA-binding transcriptional regulator YafY
MIVAWCQLRQGVRHFRVDRVVGSKVEGGNFVGQGAGLLAQWEETQKAATVDTVEL